MSKTENNLKKAIKEGNKEESISLLAAFSELKNSTDEQSNAYFEQIEAIGVVDDDEVLGNVEEEEEDSSDEVVVVAPRVEKRGVKAKSIERKEIEKAFTKVEELSVDYFAQVKRGATAEARFAKRMVSRLRLIRKQVIK